MENEYIVIKDMKMPEGCFDCKLVSFDLFELYCPACNITKEGSFFFSKKKLPECPLMKFIVDWDMHE